jgi:predicted ABC-type ATPase
MPRVVVIGGINGAGKTTTSLELLRSVLNIPVFTNADAIARGLNSLNPEAEAFRAGRIMLEWMNDLAAEGRDFAFETTLAARTYVSWLRKLKERGYTVHLYYYWLRTAEVAIGRVALRVQSGGHHIPTEDVRRRYSRSVKNFIELYRPIADDWEVFDNTYGDRKLIATGNLTEELYETDSIWEEFKRSASHVEE